MKKILIALTTAGLFSISAQAQSGNAINYSVCKNTSGYHICGQVPNYANSTPTAYTVTTPGIAPANVAPADNYVAPVSPNNYTCLMVPVSSVETPGYARRHNIFYADDARAPYEGLPSRQYDGPEKNIQRNVNYNQTSFRLPANDGK